MTTRDILLEHLPYKPYIGTGRPNTSCSCGRTFPIVTEWANHVAVLIADDVVPTARWSDPSESHAAARSVRSTGPTHRRLMSLFKELGIGMTDSRIKGEWARKVRDEGWPPVSDSGLRTRRRELVTAGLLRDSRRRLIGDSGRRTAVWEVNE